MLIRHTLKYLPAQLLAPAAQLASMVLWTHWLSPSEMGTYTLVIVAQEMAYALCLGWFSVYALRYLPSAQDPAGRQRYLGAENAVVLGSVFGSLVVASIVVGTLPHDGSYLAHNLLVAVYFASRGFNAHYAERARAQQAFFAYTLLQVFGPVAGLGLGWLVVSRLRADAWGLLGAYAAAQLLGTWLALPLLGMRFRSARLERALLRDAITFGFPILGLAVLGWIAENYLRYLVQWWSGAAALGMMTVGWSLGRRCAGVASMLVATAGFPLAARLLNEGRRAEALAQLGSNAALLLAVLVPVTAGMALLAPALVALTVAPAYREVTVQILGVAVLGGAIRNLHVHVTDQLMVLERRIRRLAAVDAIEILACGLASLAGLTIDGLRGAIAGQAVGSALTLAVSAFWARRHLGWVWPWGETVRVGIATLAMAVALACFAARQSVSGVVAATAFGGAVYALALAVAFMPRGRRLLAARRRS